MTEASPVLVVRKGDVAIVTLNRPERRNALDLEMVQALHRVFDELGADDALGVVIVTGAGDKAFVSGADIAQLKERKTRDALRGINSTLFKKIEECPLPTIAAVNGVALGGGCELAMACDLRVAGASAKFGQPEVSLGIIPAAGALYRLPRLVGLGRAKELVFTAKILSAADAAQIGLVNRVVPDGEVLAAAEALAAEILQNGRLAVRLAKAAMQAVARPFGDPTATVENLAQAILFESDEKHQRMGEFLARRASKTKEQK